MTNKTSADVVLIGAGVMSATSLGASPGASTAVSIMIELLKRCFREKMQQPSWQQKLKEIIPSYSKPLAEDEQLASQIRERTHKILGLGFVTKTPV